VDPVNSRLLYKYERQFEATKIKLTKDFIVELCDKNCVAISKTCYPETILFAIKPVEKGFDIVTNPQNGSGSVMKKHKFVDFYPVIYSIYVKGEKVFLAIKNHVIEFDLRTVQFEKHYVDIEKPFKIKFVTVDYYYYIKIKGENKVKLYDRSGDFKGETEYQKLWPHGIDQGTMLTKDSGIYNFHVKTYKIDKRPGFYREEFKISGKMVKFERSKDKTRVVITIDNKTKTIKNLHKFFYVNNLLVLFLKNKEFYVVKVLNLEYFDNDENVLRFISNDKIKMKFFFSRTRKDYNDETLDIFPFFDNSEEIPDIKSYKNWVLGRSFLPVDQLHSFYKSINPPDKDMVLMELYSLLDYRVINKQFKIEDFKSHLAKHFYVHFKKGPFKFIGRDTKFRKVTKVVDLAFHDVFDHFLIELFEQKGNIDEKIEIQMEGWNKEQKLQLKSYYFTGKITIKNVDILTKFYYLLGQDLLLYWYIKSIDKYINLKQKFL